MADTPQIAPASSAPAQAATTKPVVDNKAVPVAKVADKIVEDSWDVVIDGKPVKKTRKEILDAYQLRELSDKKRSEADKVLQDYQKLYGVLKNDPVKFLQAAGFDFDKLATGHVARKAQEAMRDPREVELEKAKAEAEQYKKWVDDQKSATEQASKAAAVQATRESIHKQIIEAVEANKELGMPVDENLIINIAQQMMLQDKKQKPLDAKEALPKVYQKTQSWITGLAAKMDGEKLVSWLGQDVANKIRKYDLTQLKAKRAAVTPSAQSSVKPVSRDKPSAQKPITWSQWKEKQSQK